MESWVSGYHSHSASEGLSMTVRFATCESIFPAPIADCVLQSVDTYFTSLSGGKLIRREDQSPSTAACVAGVISFVGDGTWVFNLILPEQTATALVRKFAGFDIPFDSGDMGDTIGELVNVLAGDIVARLHAVGKNAQMSLPTLMRGQNIELFLPASSPEVQRCFESKEGTFWYKLGVAKSGSHVFRKLET
jgi:CheY-specific phosphatase CheX